MKNLLKNVLATAALAVGLTLTASADTWQYHSTGLLATNFVIQPSSVGTSTTLTNLVNANYFTANPPGQGDPAGSFTVQGGVNIAALSITFIQTTNNPNYTASTNGFLTAYFAPIVDDYVLVAGKRFNGGTLETNNIWSAQIFAPTNGIGSVGISASSSNVVQTVVVPLYLTNNIGAKYAQLVGFLHGDTNTYWNILSLRAGYWYQP